MTRPKHIREILTFARDLGIRDATMGRLRKHVCIVGTLPNGKPLRMPVPWRPDPCCGAKNLQLQLRRAVRA